MTDSSELQGEIAALRCFVAALASTLPLASQLRLWPAFEGYADLVRDRLTGDAVMGFERTTVSLSSKRVAMPQTSATGTGAALEQTKSRLQGK